MATPTHRQALPVGYRLQNYRLRSVLGVGGFGVTYLAAHATLGHRVAIKEYLPNEFAVRDGTTVYPKSDIDKADFEWGLGRFLDEAKTLARFDHRNLVRVRDYFEANRTAYIVMDYEDGEPLDKLLEAHGTLSEAQLKRVLRPVMQGLEQVHAAGYLHRDIKPSNVFVRRSDESPVLLDFGAARQALGRKSKSLTAVASAGYSPPEQYESEGEQGPWTDIYALSALCYRAITGHAPIEAPRRQSRLLRGQQDPLVKLSDLAPEGYSQALLHAVDWGLQLIEVERPPHLRVWAAAVETEALPETPELRNVGGSSTPPKQDTQEPRKPNQKAAPNRKRLTIAVALVACLAFMVLLLDAGSDGPQDLDGAELHQPGAVTTTTRSTSSPAEPHDPASMESPTANGSVSSRAESITVGSIRRQYGDQVAEYTDQELEEAAFEIYGRPYGRSREDFRAQFHAGSSEPVQHADEPPPTMSAKPEPDQQQDGFDYRSDPEFAGLTDVEIEERRTNAIAAVMAKHPDLEQIRQDSDFEAWLQASPLRVQASQSWRSDVAMELLDSWKAEQARRSGASDNGDDRQGSRRVDQQVDLPDGGASPYFTRGSHKDDVLRIQGTPTRINRFPSSGKEVWAFGLSSVSISIATGKVQEWSDHARNLRVRLEPGPRVTDAQYFTRGSHKDDVLRIQGTPTRISRFPSSGKEVWAYGLSSVSISIATGKVQEWSDHARNLRVRLEPGPRVTDAQYFTRGSHKDDVLRIQGTPTRISRFPSSGKEVWAYGLSSVSISIATGKVQEWSDHAHNLRVRLEPGPRVTDAQYFTRGSHKDDVLRIQGTPTRISRFPSSGKEVWAYGLSSVSISITTGKVEEWSDHARNLKVRLQPGD